MPVTIESPVNLGRARFHGLCEVGAFTYFNGPADIFHTSIGRYCSIAPEVIIGPGEHPTQFFSSHPFAFGGGGSRFKYNLLYQAIKSPVRKLNTHRQTIIGSDVWIGMRAYISQGVHIGHGCIIAANAVVTKDVSPYSIVGGVPAKLIRLRFEPKLIDRFLALEWWKWRIDRHSIGNLDFTCVEESLAALEQLKGKKQLAEAFFKKRRMGNRWYQRLL